MTKPNTIHETLASQIDHMKPAHLVPGKTIGIEIVDRTAIKVVVVPTGVTAVVRLDEGADLYDVTVTNHKGETSEFPGSYCDQLGDLIFGVNAEPWTQPMGGVFAVDDEWNIIEGKLF